MSDQKFDWFRIVLLAIAVAGVLLSLTLVRMSAGERPPEVLAWACGEPSPTGQTDCDKALGTLFASVRFIPPRPIPTATLGMAYFTTLGLWLLVVGRLPGKLHRFWLIPSIAGVVGLVVSAFFVYTMYVTIDAPCRLCLLTHLLNVPLVLGIWILWVLGPSRQVPEEPREGDPASWAMSHLWKIPVLALVVGLAIGIAQVRDAQTTDAIKAFEAESNTLDKVSYMNARFVEIPIDDDDPVLGPINAPHTVVIFSDLQCPACAQFGPLFKQIQKELAVQRFAQKAGASAAQQQAAVRAAATVPAEQLLAHAPFRMVFKHFPLNRTCNKYWKPSFPIPDHKHACDAAAAAEAARTLGGNDAFWKMHDAIYEHRTTLAEQPYKSLAQQIGLNGDEFEKVWRDPATMERVTGDIKQGGQIGIRTTPSIFLDGRRVDRPVKQNVQNPMAKTVEMWGRLLTYSGTLNKAAGSQPAGGTRAEQAERERLRRTRAAAATRSHAAAPVSQPAQQTQAHDDDPG